MTRSPVRKPTRRATPALRPQTGMALHTLDGARKYLTTGLTKTAPCLTAWLCNFQSLVTETDRHYARSAASTSVGPVVNVKYHVECRPSTRGADVTSGQRQADPRISYGQ